MLSIRSTASMSLAAAALLAAGAQTAMAQTYPTKPIRVITSGSGSGADTALRLIAPLMGASIGQSIVVDNKASGVIPGQTAAQAPADGYNLLYEGSGFWLRQLLDPTPYDPVKDFQPIAQSLRQPALMVVNPSVPANNVKELIALAKAKPGSLNYATGSTGSLTHLAAELFQSMAGVDFQRVNYKSGAQAVNDVVAGRVQVMFAVTVSLYPQIKAGKLKPLGLTTAKPTELAPGIATISSLGVPGYESVSNTGLFAPAKTARPIIDRVNKEFNHALLSPELKDKWFSQGVEPVGGTPEYFEGVIKAEIAKTAKLVKDRHITGGEE